MIKEKTIKGKLAWMPNELTCYLCNKKLLTSWYTWAEIIYVRDWQPHCKQCMKLKQFTLKGINRRTKEIAYLDERSWAYFADCIIDSDIWDVFAVDGNDNIIWELW